MRRHPAHVLATLLVLAVLAIAGCSSADEPPITRGAPSAAGSAADTVRVSCIDVGKGDCILLQSGGTSGLIDTGYDDTVDEVLSYLQGQGVDRLDFVIVTHYDRDHVGGMRGIGEAIPIGQVYLPNYEGADKQYRSLTKAVGELGLPTQQVTRELSLSLGSASLVVYPTSLTYVPDTGGGEGNDNDLSLVVALTHADDSYLFAGDLEEEGMDAYLEAGHGPYDVLKVPHHGRKHGNTGDFLDDVRPQIALVTDGVDDPADKKALKLLKQAGADVYRTAEDGTIVVESDGTGSYEVSTGN